MTKDEELLAEARAAFERCREAWADNQEQARADLRFARLGDQWEPGDIAQRAREKRPTLTFNRLPAFIRQVVNDARQNKPAIKVHPQDSGADPAVAGIMSGLIRNIESASDADIAYDTAIEHAVGQGFGFWRVNTRYADDASFEQDLVIERVANPFTIYGDPDSTAADSSDWNVAFIVSRLSRAAFEAQYPDAAASDWDHDFAGAPGWLDGDDVTVAEYWTRERIVRRIVALADGGIADADDLPDGAVPVGSPRETESWTVVQRIMSGAEILRTTAWAGRYIPIVPVYGDEVVDETGARHFRSLIRDAKSAQRMFNHWRTATTEMIALAPRVPWIGEKGAFDADPNWDSANSQNHATLEYAVGRAPPQRQPFAGVPLGAMREAMAAADDMKAIIGIHDASMGARSNETSGRAIMARQREGDVSTFHFIDNLARAIRHSGRILIDLIPRVYSTARMVRVLGEDMAPALVEIAPGGAFDLGAGRYDLTVSAGPSFTTRREEAALQMEAFIARAPDAAMLIGDLYAKALDWPGADEIAARMRRMVPAAALGEAGAADPELALKERAQRVDEYRAETERMKVTGLR